MKEEADKMKKMRMERYLYQLAGQQEEFIYNLERQFEEINRKDA